jgi:hypothetical protein
LKGIFSRETRKRENEGEKEKNCAARKTWFFSWEKEERKGGGR